MYMFKFKVKKRLLAAILIGISAFIVFSFFLFRFVPLGQHDEEAEFLRLVSEDQTLPENYRPKLAAVESVSVSESCAEALSLMLTAARESGCDILLLEGYADRKAQQQRYGEHIDELMAQGCSRETAEQLALKTMSRPGADEHQLGLTVDITDADYPERDMTFLESKTYKWLEENCWDYGFIIRYPEGKTDLTGRDFMPWHYRYVGVESAQLMRELDMCLEEYYTWFYSDEIIVITN